MTKVPRQSDRLKARRQRQADGLSVREWLAIFTDRQPPFAADLLDRPLALVPRALLRASGPVGRWLRSVCPDEVPIKQPTELRGA